MLLARLMTLRRLAKFWEELVLSDVLSGGRPLELEEEAGIVGRLAQAMHEHTTTLRRGLQLSVLPSVTALVSAGLAYVIERV